MFRLNEKACSTYLHFSFTFKIMNSFSLNYTSSAKKIIEAEQELKEDKISECLFR